MIENVSGRTILITGAAMGMGKLYAQYAVREGAAAVILWDVNAVELARTVNELRAAGGRVHDYVVDVSSLDAIAAAATRVRAEVGDPDIVINNAGIVRGKPFWEHESGKDIALTMAINALAPMYIAREFLPAMMANRGRESRIVNIASAAAFVATPNMSVYCASKWSVNGWSDSLRLELAINGHGHVKVTTVNPSYISTGMFHGAKKMFMTPIMTPEYVTTHTWAAMKSGRARLHLPWTIYLSNILKSLLPLVIYDWLALHVLGIYHSMSEFKGRGGAS